MTIIAATDYSEIAENAVEYAAAVAKFVKAKLILLNDLTLTVSTSNSQLPAHRIQGLMDENAARLAEKAASLSARYGIEASAKTTFSFVTNELKTLLAEHQGDLIVMGMAEKSIEQDLWGNTTTSVIKKLHSPVLAVPAGARFERIKKVLFACDIIHGVSAQLLERVRTVALDNQAEVEVLLVNKTVEELKQNGTNSSDALRDIEEGLEGIQYYYKNIKSDSVIEAIKKEIEQSGTDLLIMAPQKHGFWDAVVHQSKTRKMAAGLNIPLLSIPVS